MRTVTLQTVTPEGRVRTKRFAALGPAAIAVCQILGDRKSRKGLTRQEIAERLPRAGICLEENPSALSNLLQQLLQLGVVTHPDDDHRRQRYRIAVLPDVCFTVEERREPARLDLSHLDQLGSYDS